MSTIQYPQDRDLRSLVRFCADKGMIWLDENRMILMHGAALSALRNAFERGPYAKAVPVAIEAPFSLPLGGQLVRGRIDAVYPGTGGARYQVVDWKTGDVDRADPAQLAIYRQAWADLVGASPSQVQAGFFDILADRLVTPRLPPESAWTDAVKRLS